MTRWLVTGGAGYIGAHVVRALLESGRSVTILDDFSSGHRAFVPDAARLVRGSLLEPAALADAFADSPVGVIHLAGFKYAGESVGRPLHTYRQNVSGTIELLDAMRRAGCANIVFSSSAGVYGTPSEARVTESTPPGPESPYGETKLIGEWLIRDEERAAALDHRVFRGVALRYFNVIGSATRALPDTSPHNLLPKVFAVLARGEVPQINGNDYPTPDGTNVRDYVHVNDVALAHVTAAAKLEAGVGLAPAYNLGSGTGASVAELMSAIARATGIDFTPNIGPRRPGDPASIVADGTLAARDLDWRMRHSLDETVASAWRAAAHIPRD